VKSIHATATQHRQDARLVKGGATGMARDASKPTHMDPIFTGVRTMRRSFNAVMLAGFWLLQFALVLTMLQPKI